MPLICRLGHVTKAEIGSIRIFEKETKFEIVKPVAERFAAAAAQTAEDDIKIQPAGAPGPKDDRPFKPRPSFAPRGPNATRHGCATRQGRAKPQVERRQAI